MAARIPLLPRWAPLAPRTQQTRAFSSSTSLLRQRHYRQSTEEVKPSIPEYPHGPSHLYKQSNRGLYGGQAVQYGNNISHKTHIHTRRTWHPSVETRGLWSNILKKLVRTRVTKRTLRTIDKAGGLDQYLLGNTPGRIKQLGVHGWKLRWQLLQTRTMQVRFKEERRKLGLGEEVKQGEADEEIEKDAVLDLTGGS